MCNTNCRFLWQPRCLPVRSGGRRNPFSYCANGGKIAVNLKSAIVNLQSQSFYYHSACTAAAVAYACCPYFGVVLL